jgi:predicted ferric reductase
MRRFLSALFLLNLIVTVACWWTGSRSLLPTNPLIAIGLLAGLLAQMLILTELILVSRLTLVEQAFGFDKLNQLHRWLGYTLGVAILVHPILMIWGGAAATGTSALSQTQALLSSSDDIFNAFVGLGLLLVAVIISVPTIRRKLKYETWHFGHLLMYVAIGFVFGHQTENTDVGAGVALYYWLALNFGVFGVLILYRFLKPIFLYQRHKFYVEKIIPETPNVYSVYITGKNLEKFRFNPGQFLHVSFLTTGLWAPHPFSISQAYNGRNIRISVKASGDHTSRINTLKVGTKVFLEGPFGRFTPAVAKTNKYLFIAGGIGITPIRAMIEMLAREHADMLLLYGNRTEQEIAFKDELSQLIPNTHNIIAGRIDEEKIKQLAPDFASRDIYLCGPPPMMNSIITILKNLGVPRSHLHYEKFAY